ncbi:MAG: ABC transporter ATP-binding protein [Candidatus Pacebacteria bacterium]|nr:ABC transporter ATP-binding protein [Candidatus Paceibacterota bacterium]
MKSYLSRILFYIKPHIKKYKVSFFLIFFSYAFGIIFDSIVKPYLYKEIIDSVSSGATPDVILSALMAIAGLLVITIILHNVGFRVGDYASSYFQSKVMKDLYDSTFDRLLKHSYYFFSNNFSGSIVAKTKRFTRSFETLADIISYQIFFSLVTVSGIIVILFIKAPLLAWIFLAWALLYITITVLFIKRKMAFDLEEAAADSRVTARLSDAILNVLTIKIFARDKEESEAFKDVTSDEEKRRRHAWYMGNFQNALQAFLMAILQFTVIYVSIHLWYEGLLSVGTFALLVFYMFNLFDILWSLGKSLTKAIKATTDMKEIVDIFDLEIDVMDSKKPEPVKIGKGEIHFDDVSFIYKGGINVLEHFTLAIRSGERIGVVGHSGAGKSTITKLLLRFIDVTKGAVKIDGQDIKEITQNDLRSVISYVPQDSILFHRTIRENIAYGKPEASDEEIQNVARKAHAHEFITKLPKGYDTLVGERGVKLSGGERQRVAIARAMLKNTPILVLDEATSSLDSVSESYIQEAFAELMKNKTVIVIAHRLSTVQKMDRIIVLEDGEIVGMGTHSELVADNKVYAELWNHQTGGFLQE